MEVLAVVALTGAVLYYEATKRKNQDDGSNSPTDNSPGSQTIQPPLTLQPPNPPIVTQPISLKPPPGNPPPPPPPLRLQPPSTSGGGGPAWNPIGGPQQPPTSNPISPGDDLPAIDGIKECSIGGFYVHGVEGDGKDFYTLWRGGDRGFGSVTDKNGKKWFLWWNQGCP